MGSVYSFFQELLSCLLDARHCSKGQIGKKNSFISRLVKKWKGNFSLKQWIYFHQFGGLSIFYDWVIFGYYGANLAEEHIAHQLHFLSAFMCMLLRISPKRGGAAVFSMSWKRGLCEVIYGVQTRTLYS